MSMFKQALEEAEQKIYIKAYEYAKFNQSEAARLLGVSRTTFINRIKQWKENLPGCL